MILGYNTNGLAHHDPIQAVELLAEIGYRSVAITLDHHVLNPWARDLDRCIDEMREALARHKMRNVVETGARFLLDHRTKHEPTLVTADPQGRQKRIEFICRAIDIAAELNSDAVSLWSGILRDDASYSHAVQRLADSLSPIVEYANKKDVTLAFEPEPGMLIDTMDSFGRLLEKLNDPILKLTLDVGHLFCQGETPVADYIRLWGNCLANVHIEDMRAGVHEHLMFGEGEMEFGPILDAFHEVGYKGGLHVELSRHSHQGPDAARRAYEYLKQFI